MIELTMCYCDLVQGVCCIIPCSFFCFCFNYGNGSEIETVLQSMQVRSFRVMTVLAQAINVLPPPPAHASIGLLIGRRAYAAGLVDHTARTGFDPLFEDVRGSRYNVLPHFYPVHSKTHWSNYQRRKCRRKKHRHEKNRRDIRSLLSRRYIIK